jgi:hypothetical protein
VVQLVQEGLGPESGNGRGPGPAAKPTGQPAGIPRRTD